MEKNSCGGGKVFHRLDECIQSREGHLELKVSGNKPSFKKRNRQIQKGDKASTLRDMNYHSHSSRQKKDVVYGLGIDKTVLN